MRTWRIGVGGIGAMAVLAFSVVRLHAQSEALTLVPPELRPTNGLFYSTQNPDHPPLPVDLFPELPLYWVQDDSFLVDDESVNYEGLKALWAEAFPTTGGQTMSASSSSDCGTLLVTTNWTTASDGTVLELMVTGAISGTEVDVFGTYSGFNDAPELYWYWLARVTNNQVLTITNGACWQGWYMAGCTNDTDEDGLTDAYELLVTKTSPDTNHSVNVLFTDAEMENVLVNDLRQDCGNEQNTQFETTCVVAGTNIIVAWVDSNQGVYGLGSHPDLTNYTPRLVAYAVSSDGGRTFEDMGVPPLSLQDTNTTSDDGDAGDPVLAVDRASGAVYLVGTSARNDGHHGIPLWRSTDCGLTFSDAINVLDNVQDTDKPWVTVDDWPGTGQHYVYIATSTGVIGAFPNQTNGFWLTVSSNGWMTNWSEPILIRRAGVDGVLRLNDVIPVVGPDHKVYAFWWEVDTGSTNTLRMRLVSDRGTVLGDVLTVTQLVTTNSSNGNLQLKRSNTATNTDNFNVFPFPVPAVNPSTNKLGHLYVAYADRGTNANDKADIFFVRSTNGGSNWTSPQRVNTDTTTNDQWMPVLSVKPDGTELFMAWYDRRNDTNNGLIEMYGLFADVETDGTVNLTNANEFRISTTSFPMVFAGTRGEVELVYTNAGYYDPVYPPADVDLNWWYQEWPTGTAAVGGVYARHVGEYNGVTANNESIYFTWTDYRLPAVASIVAREQSDIRFLRIDWP